MTTFKSILIKFPISILRFILFLLLELSKKEKDGVIEKKKFIFNVTITLILKL